VRQPVKLPDNPGLDASWQAKYTPRINGDFVGITDEIMQGASCRWGIADNLIRARAVQESSWDQSKVGDFEARPIGQCAPGWSTAAV
jgi:autotransporter family porin